MKKIMVSIVAMFAMVNVFADAHDVAFDLIARNEGYRANAYVCTAGKLTIGYGFTSKQYTSKKFMSKDEANKILHTYVDACLRSVNGLDIKVELTNNQKAVLADMIYHFGSGAIHNANDLLNAINSGNPDRVKAQLMRWVKQKKIVNGKVVRDSNGKIVYETVSGLVNRQARLCQLWTK